MNNKRTFYNENHVRDSKGHIIKRDFSTFRAVPCSLCQKPIKGKPSFSKHGKPDLVYGLAAGLRDPNRLKPFTDLGNVDYCEDCHIRFEIARIKLQNKSKRKKQ